MAHRVLPPTRKSSGLRRYLDFRALVIKEGLSRFVDWFKNHPIISLEWIIAAVAVAYFSGIEVAESQLIGFLTVAAAFLCVIFLWFMARASYDLFCKLEDQNRVLQQELKSAIRSKDTLAIIEGRQRWKREFETHLEQTPGQRNYGPAIISDMERVDSYPEIDDAPGISPWFKVEIMRLYHRGVEVYLRISTVKYDEARGRWYYARYDEPGAISGFVVGKIPFDVIRTVEWDGDQYYNMPHIYCEFSRADKQPYEEIVFYQSMGAPPHEWFQEIAKFDDVLGQE